MHTDTPFNHYGSLAAEVYDLAHPIGAMPDTAFHLARFAGFPGRILEPACGSGRVLAPLLEAGCDMCGFDASAEMLERCRARCAAGGFHPPLSRQRFEDFSYEERFAAILVPAGSFTLIDTFHAALAALRRFRDHLAPGGVLVLDMDPLRSLAAKGDDRRSWTAENGDLLTYQANWVKIDWLAQRGEAMGRYERWRGGRLMDSQLMPWAQRFWGLEEFRFALQSAGFRVTNVTGGYDAERPVSPRDRIWTFEALRDGQV